ncbi:MAG: hypothetical protein ABIY55_12275 [Kofleriaceae bacterium]
MTKTKLTITVVLATATLGACNWTTFDDLADETWVGASGKPDIKSADWGVAIQRGANSASSQNGGTLAIIGAGSTNTFSELTYDENGGSHFAPNSLALGAQGIMTLDSPTIFLANPASSEISLVTSGSSGSIVVAGGVDTLTARQLFVTNTTLHNTATIPPRAAAATYMQPKEFPALPGSNPPPAPIIGVGNVVLGTILNIPNGSAQPACRLTDGTNGIDIQALGAVSAGTTDDLLAWSADGRLFRYTGDVFNGCADVDPPTAPQFLPALTDKPAFTPGAGSQILTIDATHVLLDGQTDPMKGKGSFLQVFESTPTSLKPVGNAITIESLHSAAILDVGGTKYVVAGYPTALVGAKKAGQVMIFRIGATGLETTQVATFNDAQPEDNQSFGRAVAVMPYRGKNVIAVAADNEIFVYFRATLEDGSDLYGETRQGK